MQLVEWPRSGSVGQDSNSNQKICDGHKHIAPSVQQPQQGQTKCLVYPVNLPSLPADLTLSRLKVFRKTFESRDTLTQCRWIGSNCRTVFTEKFLVKTLRSLKTSRWNPFTPNGSGENNMLVIKIDKFGWIKKRYLFVQPTWFCLANRGQTVSSVVRLLQALQQRTEFNAFLKTKMG